MNWSLLSNSLWLSGATTLCATTIGFLAAVWAAGLERRARQIVTALAVIGLAMPPFLAVNAWLDLLGPNGAWRGWMPFPIHSLPGAIWILTLLYWPISFLLTLSAWSPLEASQLASDPALRGSALVRWLLWPMARGAVGQAALLIFVLALNQFSVPVILQVHVFPEELWLALTTRLDEAGAWAAALPLVAVPALMLLRLRRVEFRWPRSDGTVAARALRRQLGAPTWTLGGGVAALALIFSIALPLGDLVLSRRTWMELPNLCRASPEVIWNSFAFAAGGATVSAVLGWLVARLRIGWLLWFFFLIPGVLLGRAMIFAFIQTPIYGTSMLAIVACGLRFAAIHWHSAALGLSAMDRDVTDAARAQGAGGWTLLRHGYWPQLAPTLATAWYVTYLLGLWDVETLVLIYPPGGETLALRVFNFLHYGHHAQANASCLILLGLALAPLALWQIGRHLKRN